MAETEAIAKSMKMQNDLDEAYTQIKFLEGQIRRMEEKVEYVKKQYQRREDDLFDMLDSKKHGNS